MLIDFHIHVSRREHARSWVLEFMQAQFAEGDAWAALDPLLTPAGLSQHLRANGIDWAVALAEVSPATSGSTSNEYVADLCAKANALPEPPSGPRGKLIPFASLNPFIVNDPALELEGLVKEFGFRGLKAYPVH